MSSAASITFDPDTSGVTADQWTAFCTEHTITYSPHTVGNNVYHACACEVEIIYSTHRLVFSTYWYGKRVPDVARLAMAAWCRWGGKISADPEIRPSHACAYELDHKGMTRLLSKLKVIRAELEGLKKTYAGSVSLRCQRLNAQCDLLEEILDIPRSHPRATQEDR